MTIYYINRELEVLGIASTNLSSGFQIIDDMFAEDIDSGVATFDMSVLYGDERQKLEMWSEVGNYILYEADNTPRVLQIIESETNTADMTVSVYAEDAGLDLIGEIAQPYTATEQHPIEFYISRFLGDSDFVIGINEIPELQRKLSWDGSSTVTERIRSIATQFENCEISYSFDIRGMQIYRKYVNIWEKRGTDTQQELRLNREINAFHIKTSIANLVTGLVVTGGTPEGSNKPITLVGYSYDDGDYYVDERGRLLTRSGAERWSRMAEGDGYIVGNYSYNTTSKSELLNRALSYLKTYSQPEVNYEVEVERGTDDLHIGDRINVVDDQGGVYLSARVLKLELSVTRDTKEVTLGEYLIKSSGISEKVTAWASTISALASSANDYQLTIVSSNGNDFNTTLVNTVLTAKILYKGTTVTQSMLTNAGMQVTWYDEINETVLGTGMTLSIVNEQTINVTARLEQI